MRYSAWYCWIFFGLWPGMGWAQQEPTEKILQSQSSPKDWEQGGFSLLLQPLYEWQSQGRTWGTASSGNKASVDTSSITLLGMGIVPTWRFHSAISLALRLDYRVPFANPGSGGAGLFWRTGMQLLWHVHPSISLFAQGHYLGRSTLIRTLNFTTYPACTGQGVGSQLGLQWAVWKTPHWQMGVAGGVGTSWTVCSRPANNDASKGVLAYTFDPWQWRWEGVIGPIVAWR